MSEEEPRIPGKQRAVTLTMRSETRIRLEAMSTLLQQPSWRIVDHALGEYFATLDPKDREAVEVLAQRTISKLNSDQPRSGISATGRSLDSVHKGIAKVTFTFAEAWEALNKTGRIALKTKSGKDFEALAGTARGNRKVLRYFQNGKEYGRAYECCWGHRTNCNRTWIGMYSEPLDKFLRGQ